MVLSRIPIGSALKFWRLACADADVYPRFVGTSEWDQAAGGLVIVLETGERLRYGKSRRRNGGFVAFRGPYAFKQFKLTWT